MNIKSMRAAQFAIIVLGAGVTAGALMAMATPTAMSRHGNDTWKDRVEDTYGPSYGPDYAVADVPPQDLTPMKWIGTPSRMDAAWRDDTTAAPTTDTDLADLLDHDDPSLESARFEQVMVRRGSDPHVAVIDQSDAAGVSAQAAQEAAADVRGAVSAAADDKDDGDAAADSSLGASAAQPAVGT
jgi:hypothetical protein